MTELGNDAGTSAGTAESAAPEGDSPASGERADEAGAGPGAGSPASEPGESGPAEPSADQQAEPLAAEQDFGGAGPADGAERAGREQAEPAPDAEPTPDHEPTIGVNGEGDQDQPAATERGGEQEADTRASEPGELGPAEATTDQQGPGAADTADRSGAQQPSTEQAGEQQDTADTHPELYKRTDGQPPKVDGPHNSPEKWLSEINPGKGLTNCGDCARAVQQTWEGNPRWANVGGPEDYSVMTEWAGASAQPSSLDQVGAKLNDLGPGSSAIVSFERDNRPGHYFNALNDNQTIKAVDGQTGRTETWPPSISGMRFGQAEMRNVKAIFFDANGKVVR